MTAANLDFVHRFVPGQGATAQTTLLLLHGTGGNENDLLDLGSTLVPGAALLSPRGKVLESGMPRFFRRLAEGVFDLADLQQRTHELADFVLDACEAYALDQHRVVAVGYSNGANIAASALFLRPEAMVAAILFRSTVPIVPPSLPNLSGKSVFIAGGRRDPIANPSDTRRLVDILSQADAAVQLYWHDGGHELGHDDLVAAQNWIKERIKGFDEPIT